MIKLKIKKYKWFILLITIFLLFISYELKPLFEKTYLYHALCGKTISLKEIMESRDNLGFNERFKGRGAQLQFKPFNSGTLTYDEYLVTGFEYLLQFQDFTSLEYDLKYVPKNISEILNQLPNLKELTLYVDEKDNLSYFKNLKHIEKLYIPYGKLNYLNNILDTYEKIKEVELSFKYVDKKVLIGSNTLEKLYFEISDNTSDEYTEKAVDIDLETPNLKILKFKRKVGAPTHLGISFEKNDNEIIDLEKIRIENFAIPSIWTSGDNLKIKELIILNGLGKIDHENIFIGYNQFEHLLRSIFPDSIKKLVFVDEYLNITDFNYLENLKNLTELSLSVANIVDLTSIQNLENLKKLHLQSPTLVNIDNIDKLKNLSSLGIYGGKINDYSALKNMKNLKELTVHYSALERLPDLEQLENLYLIREFYEIRENDEKDLQIKLNGKFKNTKVSFSGSNYILSDNNYNSTID